MSLKNPSDIKQITKHSKHPVRFLSSSEDGLLCYFFNGEIYTLQPGKQPKKLAVDIIADNTESPIAKMIGTGELPRWLCHPTAKNSLSLFAEMYM